MKALLSFRNFSLLKRERGLKDTFCMYTKENDGIKEQKVIELITSERSLANSNLIKSFSF